jgi:hypothetical protein
MIIYNANLQSTLTKNNRAKQGFLKIPENRDVLNPIAIRKRNCCIREQITFLFTSTIKNPPQFIFT